nr:hypothetical protein [Tanacetum cinerariifolium]
MNYMPVDAGTNSTNLSGTKDGANQEERKNESSWRYILLPNWAHDALLESTSSKPYEESSSQVPEGSGNPNFTASTFNPLAEQMETLTVESPIPTVKENQKKDKIGSKPDKNEKRDEAGKSQKPLQLKEEEKPKKTKKEWPKTHARIKSY